MKYIETILDTTRRQPRLIGEDVPNHTYNDEYNITEFVTNTSIAAQMNALERLGLDPSKLVTVLGWVHTNKKNVTIRFEADDTCNFLMEQDVEMNTGISNEIEYQKSTTTNTTSSASPSTSKSTKETSRAKVITKVREYRVTEPQDI